MEKNLKEKYKTFESKISLSKILSEDEQKNLLSKPASDRMQVIIAKIAAAAKAEGIPSELLKKGSYTYEAKKDKKGKTSIKNMSNIEKLSKKVNKEYEEKHPGASQFTEGLSATIRYTKDFIDKLLTVPSKEARVQMVKAYITPQFLSQGWSEEILNKPLSSMKLNNKFILSKRGEMPFIDFISRLDAERFSQTREKAQNKLDEMNERSDFVGLDKKNKAPKNIQKPQKNKDIISQSSDAINDMVTGGEPTYISKDANNNFSAKDGFPKKLEDMTPDEQVEYLSALGLDSMLPPGLKRD